MVTSESINELAAALAKAQGEMGGAIKESANPFFKSKYADLASVWEACRRPLATNGIAVIQSPSVSDIELTLAADTFRDFGNVLGAIGEDTMAAAARIAERHIRERLASIGTEERA